MANERYTRTNQKLFFAGLSLEAWRRAVADDGLEAPGRVQAEREASLFHLHGALLGLCQEVAGFYRTPQADATAVEAILDRAALEAHPTPELAELLEIAGNPDTWLSELLRHYRRLFEPLRAPAKAKQDPGLPLIEAVSLDTAEPALSPDEVEAWRRELKAVTLRFRQGMTEW